MMQPGADVWNCRSAQTGCQDATSCTPQRGEVGPHIHELSYVALGRAERRVSTRIPRRAPHKWAISCTSVENSSAGCIPERSVIFPPYERPFAGAILSEKLISTLCNATNLYSRSRYPLTSPFTSVRVGSSLPSVWLTSKT